MIKLRAGGRLDRAASAEFPSILQRSVQKLAFEQQLEAVIARQRRPERPQAARKTAFLEPRYETSAAWLDARARLRGAAVPASHAPVRAEEGDTLTVEEGRHAAFKFKASAPRKPRIIDNEL